MKKSICKLGLIMVTGALLTACQSNETSKSVKSENTGVIRTTQFGKVKGKDEGKVLTWYGIPYGGDVSGTKRWTAPSDPEKWSGTKDTTKAGTVAIQFNNGKVIGEENALNLDIYRPDNSSKNLPVMVYIHGGNNQTGQSSEISGKSFAEKYNVIFVSVNYRLGALGFNPLNAIKTGSAEEKSGNYALLDIAKSLDWVRENISEFGGDSKNVTLSGFSAGGRDVMASLISPIFKGKYDKAISFSGGMTTSDEAASQEVFAQAIAPLVVEDGIKSTEEEAIQWLLTDSNDVKDYLQKVDATRLSKLMGNAMIRMSAFPHLYTDGTVIPKEGFNTSNYNDVPLLNVTGSHEFSLFSRSDPYFADALQSGEIDTNSEIKAQYDFVNNYGGQLYNLANVKNSNEKLKANGYKSPIYSTEIKFGEDESVVGTKMAPLSAFHGVFVPLLDKNSQNYTTLVGEAYQSTGAKALSNDFQSYIYNFLKNGNPNGKGLTKWDSWTDSNKVLTLNATKEEASAEMISQDMTNSSVIQAIQDDVSIPEDIKYILITRVMNGRWFSYDLDKAYNNLSTFDQVSNGN